MPGFQRAAIFLFLAGSLLFPALPAGAVYLGNPVPLFDKGEFGVGLALSDKRETVFLDIGIFEPGTLEIFGGNFDGGTGSDGTEFGLGYRHDLGKGFELGDFPVKLGVLVRFSIGSINTPAGGDLEFNVLNIGVGGTSMVLENLYAYAAALYERTESESLAPVVGKSSTTDSDFGVLLGAEYWLTESFLAGLEVHPGLEDDGAVIFAEFKF